ncbi:MAG: hypothetical protein JEZ14_18780, partial [Marinilabiliaceae bacterium]|nr:hypothetical protein [Marinilabiliaceae bacterium]
MKKYTFSLYVRLVFVFALSLFATPQLIAQTAPTFTSVAPTAATQDILYTYNITSNDDDGNTVTITAPTLPEWLTLNDNTDGTATLSGTPLNADTGDNPVTLRVSDGTTQNDQIFTIVVANVNDAPTFTSVAPTAATQDILYTYNITSNDDDG